MANQEDGFSSWIKGSESGGIRKTADLGAKGSSWPSMDQVKDFVKKGFDGSVSRNPIQFLDPAYFDPILFFIQHRDRKELNFRLRYYADYDELVGNSIDLHSSFPLSDFQLQCADRSIERHYMDLKDRIELLNILHYTLRDYWTLGEAILYGRWSDAEKSWDYFSLIPPEKVEFRSTYISPTPIVMMEVDAQLKALVTSADPVDQEIVKTMDPELVEKIKGNNHIVLPPMQVSHFCRKTSMSDLRGTSIVKRALKSLLYKDKLRLLQTTFVDRHMFPLKVFKVGNPQTGWIPNRSHFDALRDMLNQAANDPDFSLIYHYGLAIEYVGTKDKIENLIPHFDMVDKQIMTALFTNSSMTHGEGMTFANSNVSVRILMHRYLMIRSQLELMVNNKIFYPMALARGYWVPETGDAGRRPGSIVKNFSGKYKVLDVPRMRWAKLNLLDDTSQKQFLMRLREKMDIPHSVIADIFDLEEGDMRAHLEEEDGTIVDPIFQQSRAAASKLPSIQNQILRGKKTKEWILPNPEEDQAKPKPKPATPPPVGGAGAGAGGGGSPVPPAAGSTPTPSGEEGPTAPTAPGGAKPGPTTPPPAGSAPAAPGAEVV